MEYAIKGGYTLTEKDFDRLGEMCERGEYPGEPGEWVVRPKGRPRLAEEELVTIAVKVPRSQRDAIDAKAKSQSKTRSQFVRLALQEALLQCLFHLLAFEMKFPKSPENTVIFGL